MQYIKLKGKKYIVKKITPHNRYRDSIMTIEPYNSDFHKKIVEEVANLLAEAIDRKVLVQQALSKIEFDDVLKIHKKLKQGLKPRARKGCYTIVIGSEEVPIQS